MKRKKTMVYAIILFMIIGFAAVATTIFINGNVLIGDDIKFDSEVIFISAEINDGGSAVIKNDGKSIDFTSGDLKQVGDTSLLSYTVANYSTQYDATVEVICEFDDEDSNEFIQYKNTIADVILASSKEDGSVEVKLKKNTTEAKDLNIKCTLDVSPSERDSLKDDLENTIDRLSILNKNLSVNMLASIDNSSDYYSSYLIYNDVLYNISNENFELPLDGVNTEFDIYLVNIDDDSNVTIDNIETKSFGKYHGNWDKNNLLLNGTEYGGAEKIKLSSEFKRENDVVFHNDESFIGNTNNLEYGGIYYITLMDVVKNSNPIIRTRIEFKNSMNIGIEMFQEIRYLVNGTVVGDNQISDVNEIDKVYLITESNVSDEDLLNSSDSEIIDNYGIVLNKYDNKFRFYEAAMDLEFILELEKKETIVSKN